MFANRPFFEVRRGLRASFAPRLAAASLLVAAAAGLPATAFADTPGPTELEFWRSAERVGTVDAYQAYVDAYPRGTFVPIARAAIQKARGVPAAPPPPVATPASPSPTPPVAAAAPAAPAPVAPAGTGTLRPFREDAPSSGAIPFLLGDRFVGPGVLTVGWSGAKKQILLPPGEWTVLSAVDFKSDQPSVYTTISTPVRASLTTIVLARFDGNRVQSLMRFVFNSQRAVVAAWSDVARCEPESALVRQMQTRVQTKFGENCSSVRAADDWAALLGPAADETRRNLARLGASLPAGGALAATSVIGEQKGGYLGATRIDWSTAAPERLAAWLARYQQVANQGLNRSIDAEDLVAGAPASSTASAPLIDDPEPRRP